ncbi:MAG: SLC13 family permease [Polyangia bacterium]
MSTPQLALCTLLIIALLLQAVIPSLRVVIVVSAAALACLVATALGVGTTHQILAELPWDVLIILVGLGLLSEVFVQARLFGILAVRAARWSGARPTRVLIYFALAMYAVSGLVNNLTALVLVLPVLLILLKLMGASQRYVSWTLGTLLVACNLGGAATPIGDFPAILLLGSGRMSFPAYLAYAAPPTLIALVLLLGLVGLWVRPERVPHSDPESVPQPDPLAARLSVRVIEKLYRNVRLDRRRFLPAVIVLGILLLLWMIVPASSGIGADLICWLGVAVLLLLNRTLGERLVRTRIDMEAVLFLLSLFVMVAAVRRTGLFAEAARRLLLLPVPPLAQLALFLVLAGLLTGLFSAGPSMAALLEVGHKLAERMPPHAVYVGLALSVCAGSSLLLTAATSGPMAQALTERAELRTEDGLALRFGFFEFLPVGLLSFAVIQGVALAFAALCVRQ